MMTRWRSSGAYRYRCAGDGELHAVAMVFGMCWINVLYVPQWLWWYKV